MAFDPNSAQQISPIAAPVTESQEHPAPATPINVQSATLVAPQAAPTNSLDPLSGAGVMLTKIVLGIISGVLLLLIGTLIYQEKNFSDLTTDAYRLAVGSIAITPAGNFQHVPFEPILIALRAVEKDPTQSQARPSLKATADRLVTFRNSVTDGSAIEKLMSDIQSLAQDAPGQSIDVTKLHDILVRVEALSNSSVQSRDTAEQLKGRQDLLKAYLDATNATRDFWARIAQMILLNLLLPVLTALLGYVFASKQSGK